MNQNFIVCTVKPKWFERNAFVVSSTDILNVNPDVHIQDVAENFDHSIRAVVT